MRVAFYTLGCKLNQAETEFLAGQFNKAGYHLVHPDEVADIYIINTCTVTHIADRKSRHWLRLTRRKNPRSLIVATGCYAQRAPQELSQIADTIIDNKGKKHLLEIVESLSSQYPPPTITESQNPEGSTEKTKQSKTSYNTRVRSLIKIQNGCHSPCTYCIVPYVRTHEYSLPASQIISEIKEKVAVGYKEVILTGTKVGCYSHNRIDLRGLIELILHDTNIERLHLSSLQPQEISSELLNLWQDRRLCRHLHLALQSGSEIILQRMRRCYSLDDYQKTMNLMREAIPNVAITTDIMIGFPGEGDKEFEQSYRFCQQANFANIHVFPFSPRPGTVAAKAPGQVKDQVKKERVQQMLELAQCCKHDFHARSLGQIMPVLWEKETVSGSNIYSGLTDNYIRVFTHARKHLTNEITRVNLNKFYKQGMWGTLINEDSSQGKS
ncbi:MAG: tRNA (N(6)-L-threonylcarbamoyladenosine(37)-C(2))-methylthiotransferase MtaB [Dehalococcoidia bacterium]|nr:tRNA (N(6)-L-threonylcarbamoyladenosine(37)-C(2))-methylthiotransferase MtaB [Dehalococcoidia bacterium]